MVNLIKLSPLIEKNYHKVCHQNNIFVVVQVKTITEHGGSDQPICRKKILQAQLYFKGG